MSSAAKRYVGSDFHGEFFVDGVQVEHLAGGNVQVGWFGGKLKINRIVNLHKIDLNSCMVTSSSLNAFAFLHYRVHVNANCSRNDQHAAPGPVLHLARLRLQPSLMQRRPLAGQPMHLNTPNSVYLESSYLKKLVTIYVGWPTYLGFAMVNAGKKNFEVGSQAQPTIIISFTPTFTRFHYARHSVST